jgi:hypothetical protein
MDALRDVFIIDKHSKTPRKILVVYTGQDVVPLWMPESVEQYPFFTRCHQSLYAGRLERSGERVSHVEAIHLVKLALSKTTGLARDIGFQFLKMLYIDYSSQMFLYNSAKKIQRQFRESIANPAYTMCMCRLVREFGG